MTIALIDKYPVLRSGLVQLLNEHFADSKVIESDSVTNLIKNFPKQKVNLVIYGINDFADQNALDDLLLLRTRFEKSGIIVYDDVLCPSQILDYLMVGVNGYLSKSTPLNDLLECIQAVINNGKYIQPDAIALMVGQFQTVGQKVTDKIKIPPGRLTPRESEIAVYLCEGYKTSWIAEKLDRKSSTISTIKNNIFKKFEVSNVLELKKLLQ